MFRFVVALFCIGLPLSADAWDPYDDPANDDTWSDESDAFEDDLDDEDEMALDPNDEEELEDFEVDGKDILVVCIYGDRDNGSVPRKCAQVVRDLRRAYPRSI